jgi:hypothetical protein
MPWTLVIDDTARRVVATGDGEFRADDTIEVLSRCREAGALAYGLLFDARRMVGTPTVADVRPISDMTTPKADRAVGPIAIVVTSATLYRTACAYAVLARSRGGLVEVFRDLGAAEEWLGDVTA